jgi:hypothetical protein
VDKGALDALMGDPGAEGERVGSALLSECARVTSASGSGASGGGVIAVVSLLQDHVLETLVRTFRAGWRLSIRQVPPAPDMMTSPLQPFLVTAHAIAPDAAATAADEDALHYPAAMSPLPVELHTLAGGGAGAGKVINAEQARLCTGMRACTRACAMCGFCAHACVHADVAALPRVCVWRSCVTWRCWWGGRTRRARRARR